MYYREIDLHLGREYFVNFRILDSPEIAEYNAFHFFKFSRKDPLRQIAVDLMKFFVNVFKKDYRII